MKIDVGERIAQDVKERENAIIILCDLLYYTNLRTKWRQDAIEAIRGVCPKYFSDTKKQEGGES